MAKSLFSVFGEIFIDNTNANKSIDDTSKKADSGGKSIGKSFSSIVSSAGKVVTAIGGAATAIGSGLFAIATSTADTAGAIDDAAKKTGMSAEEYQKWAYAAKLGGMEVSKLESLMTRQQKSFADAVDGSTSMAEAYERLGINIAEVGDSSEAFDLVIAALADMEDVTQRNAIANDIFGKSYADLAPLLEEGSEEIERLKQEAVDLGGVMSDAAVEAGASLGDMIDRIKTAGTGIANTIGSSIMPVVADLLDEVLDKLPMVTELVGDIVPVFSEMAGELLPPLFDLIDEIFPTLIDLFSQIMPVATQIMQAVMPIILSLLQNIMPLISQLAQQILPLVVQLLNLLMPLLNAIAPILDVIFGLINTILTPLLQLLNAVLTPIISILTQLLQLILPPLMALFDALSAQLTGTLSGAFSSILGVVDSVRGMFSGLIEFLQNVFAGNWQGVWESVQKIFENVWNGIVNFGKSIINTLISFFENGLNGIINFINMITSGISTLWEWAGIPAIPAIPTVNIPRLRIGIDRVPYDDFPAILHKGERVLRASEADEYDRRQAYPETMQAAVEGGKTVNVTMYVENFAGTREDADAFSEALLERLQEELDKKGRPFQ